MIIDAKKNDVEVQKKLQTVRDDDKTDFSVKKKLLF